MGKHKPTDKKSLLRDTPELMIVDDDLGMQALLSDVMTSLGYHVTAFSEASSALHLIQSESPKIDAVICDINMPRQSGFDFLDALKKMHVLVPVILITAFGTQIRQNEAIQKGA